MNHTFRARFFAAIFSAVLILLIFTAVAPRILSRAEKAEAARITRAAQNARDAISVKSESGPRLRRFPDAKTFAWLSRRVGARIVIRPVAGNRKTAEALPADFRAALSQSGKGNATVQQLSSESIAAYLALWAPQTNASSRANGSPPAFLLRADAPRSEMQEARRLLGVLRVALLLVGAPVFMVLALLLQRQIKKRAEARRVLATPAYDEPISWDENQALANASHLYDEGGMSQAHREEVAGVRGELESTRRRLQESEETYRQMALSASDVLYAIYPGEGRIDWLGQIDLMLGYANGSFPRTVEAWADSIHPDEAEKVIELYTAVCKSGEPFFIEYKMRHRNGSYRDWLHRGRAVLDSDKKLQKLVGSCSDISEKKRAERRLRESEERLARIVETVEGAIVLCDTKGVVTFANPAAELVFGAPRSEIVGCAYGDARWNLTQPDGAPIAPDELPTARVLASGQIVREIEQMFSHASGRQLVVSVNAAPLPGEGGEVIGSVLSLIDITNRKALEDKLAFRAFHDALTKLPNRALFRDRVEHALIRSRRPKTMVAVIFLDLDNFKKTNDTLGHEAGDALLIATAARLLESLRVGDTAARFAGDEFTVMLDNITDISQAEIVAGRLLNTMMKPVQIGENEVFAPPSIGVALGNWRDDVESLLKRADETMYEAKKNGKARYEVHPYIPQPVEEGAPQPAAPDTPSNDSVPVENDARLLAAMDAGEDPGDMESDEKSRRDGFAASTRVP